MTRSALPPLVCAAAAAVLLFAQTDPWQKSDELQPADLAAQLKAGSPKPMLIYVGFPVLYKGAHIPGAILAGPVAKPEGLKALENAAANAPKNAQIVLYCGCCPFTQCPNVRPAFKRLREMGYTNVKLVIIPTNLATDWIAKGYPIEKAASAPKS